MYFSADTFFILKNHGSIKGAILENAKGGEHSPPFVRFPVKLLCRFVFTAIPFCKGSA